MSLKKAYLYLVSVISLVIAVVGAIMIINLALKTWVFPKADNNVYYQAPCVSSYDTTGKPQGCDQAQQELLAKQDAENRASQKQRDAAQALAMIIVATPVWYYHWKMARKEA